MNFEAYSERLATLHEYCFENQLKKLKWNLSKKTQFAGLNDKRYCFDDGIVSLPFGHFLSTKVREEKEKYRTNLHTIIKEKMYNVLELESRAVHWCERLIILRSVFTQPLLLYV